MEFIQFFLVIGGAPAAGYLAGVGIFTVFFHVVCRGRKPSLTVIQFWQKGNFSGKKYAAGSSY